VQLVAARTGLAQADAEKLVNDVIALVKAAEAKVRQTADAACKAGACCRFYWRHHADRDIYPGGGSRAWRPSSGRAVAL
jgi:hypothetical protein